MIIPCKNCERKGCGAYHDECEEFQAYKEHLEKCKAVRRASLDIDNFSLTQGQRRHKNPIRKRT